MEAGISSIHFIGYDLLDSIRTSADAGFRWVEIWYEQLRPLKQKGKDLVPELRATGIRWSIHADMRDLNITSRNAGIHDESLRQVQETIRYAAELEADFVTVHPGRAGSTKDSKEDYFPIQVDSFMILAETAADAGIPIGVENMEVMPRAIVTTWSDLNALLDAVASPYLGVVLDLAHLYHLPQEEQRALIDKAGPLRAVHMSDASAAVAHLLLGEGDYDYGFRARRLATRYTGPVFIEGYTPGQGLSAISRLMKAWRDIGL